VRNPDVQGLYDQLQALTGAIAQSHKLDPLLVANPDVQIAAKILAGEAGEEGYDPLIRSAETLNGLIAAIEKVAIENRSAVDSHLLGVLYAHLQDPRAREALDKAKRDYLRLAAEPDYPTSAVVNPLLALVWSDLANLEMASSSFPAAHQGFAQVGAQLARRSDAPILIYSLGMQSQAGLSDPNATPDVLRTYLVEADRLAAQLSLAQTHPLRAFLHERRAHLALETWRLPEAIEQANLAAKARNAFANLETKATSLEVQQGSHHAQQGWFRAKQIEALAAHFQGRVPMPPPEDNRTEAWAAFRQLLYKLQNREGFDLTKEEQITWEQLKPNFYGRTADCELFTMGQFESAAETVGDGIREAERLQWRTNPEKRHFLTFMYYKRAIALALAGKDGDAAAVLSDAEALANEVKVASRLDRFGAFKLVAQSLLMPLPDQFKALGRTLEEETQDLDVRIRDRDTRQLMLFVAAYLWEVLERRDLREALADAEAPIQTPQQLDKLVQRLLSPLQPQQERTGRAYQDLVQRSARDAVELLQQN
jgi:hypothetical protein